MINQELEAHAYALLAERKLQECIASFEAALREIPSTPYHVVIGRNLLTLTEAAALYLQRFYDFATSKMEVKSIYLEMNGFAINPDLWFIDAFGYKTYQGLSDLDWLCDWDTPKFDSFIITEFEDIQQVYKSFYSEKLRSIDLKQAGVIAEYLITLRLQESCGAAHRKAAEKMNALKEVVVLSTSHDFDFIYESALD